MIDTEKNIINNITEVLRRVDCACEKVNRDPKEVKLLLATKTVPVEKITIALEKGFTLIAENKIQELRDKFKFLQEIPHTSHFIGHLQTNKIKELLKYNITCIESIDNIDLAMKLHNRLLFEQRSMDIFLQVNTSFEESKFGVEPDKAIDLVLQLSLLDTLKIKGLMTIGLLSLDSEQVRKCFQLLKNIQQQIIALNIPNVDMKELSMGMSGDLETAIEEGATIIRVGTAIFGKRKTPDSYYWNEVF